MSEACHLPVNQRLDLSVGDQEIARSDVPMNDYAGIIGIGHRASKPVERKFNQWVNPLESYYRRHEIAAQFRLLGLGTGFLIARVTGNEFHQGRVVLRRKRENSGHGYTVALHLREHRVLTRQRKRSAGERAMSRIKAQK